VNQTGTLYGSTSSSQVCSTATYAGTLNPATSSLGVGNTVCGVAGTLLKNLFSGTGGGITGGSQGSGGVTDVNGNGTPPTDRYVGLWTVCTSGNSYCSTGQAGAERKDESTGLVWSRTCKGLGCSSFSTTSPDTYSWDASSASSSGKTAAELCSSGNHGESGWSLPHDKQFIQAFINGAYGNFDTYNNKWVATSDSTATTSARLSSFTTGGAGLNGSAAKTSSNRVRCVQ